MIGRDGHIQDVEIELFPVSVSLEALQLRYWLCVLIWLWKWHVPTYYKSSRLSAKGVTKNRFFHSKDIRGLKLKRGRLWRGFSMCWASPFHYFCIPLQQVREEASGEPSCELSFCLLKLGSIRSVIRKVLESMTDSMWQKRCVFLIWTTQEGAILPHLKSVWNGDRIPRWMGATRCMRSDGITLNWMGEESFPGTGGLRGPGLHIRWKNTSHHSRGPAPWCTLGLHVPRGDLSFLIPPLSHSSNPEEACG